MSILITPKPGSGSSPSPISFTFTNNQTSPANITGFDISYPSSEGFKADYVISRRYTGVSGSVSEDTAFYANLGTAFTGGGAVRDIVVQPADQKLLVGGDFSTFDGNTRHSLVRLNTDGTEDTAFYANLGSSFNSTAASMAVQTNNQILVGGDFNTFNGNTRVGLVRLNSDGTEDTAFYTNLGNAFNSTVYAVTLQSNGQILVGGTFTSFNVSTRNGLVRLNSDGTEDTAFYANLGSGFSGGSITVNTVVVQANGQIIVGGTFNTFNGNTREALVRLNSDGTEDTAFYANLGSAFSPNETIGIAVQPNNQILVGGGFTTFNGNTRNYLVRLNSDGTEDAAYYTNLGTGFDNTVNSIIVQSDSASVLGGAFANFNGNARGSTVRLNSDGTEDSAVYYAALGTGFNNSVLSVAIQSDNKLLLGGFFTTLNSSTRNELVRLNNVLAVPDTENVAVGSFRGAYLPSLTSWVVGSQDSFQPEMDPGIVFSITTAGQVQYTSSNIPGTVIEDSISFLITAL